MQEDGKLEVNEVFNAEGKKRPRGKKHPNRKRGGKDKYWREKYHPHTKQQQANLIGREGNGEVDGLVLAVTPLDAYGSYPSHSVSPKGEPSPALDIAVGSNAAKKSQDKKKQTCKF